MFTGKEVDPKRDLDKEGADKDEIYFIEANTLPGFTAISMYPQLWQEAGLEYGDLIDRLVELALEEF